MQKIAFQGLKFVKIFPGGHALGPRLGRAIVPNLTHFQNRKLEGLSKTGKKLLEELQQKVFEPQVA